MVILPIRPAVFNDDIAAFLVAKLPQAFTECVEEIGFERRGGISHEADARNLGWAAAASGNAAAALPSNAINSRRFMSAPSHKA